MSNGSSGAASETPSSRVGTISADMPPILSPPGEREVTCETTYETSHQTSPGAGPETPPVRSAQTVAGARP